MARLAVCLLFTCSCLAESPNAIATPAATLHGMLVQRENQPAAIETPDHKLVELTGDGATEHILHDKRLVGMEFEILGHFVSPNRFQADPSYTHAVHVVKDGKRFMVTYWCDVCSIRQYEPGPCWCCQRETRLDLRPLDAQP